MNQQMNEPAFELQEAEEWLASGSSTPLLFLTSTPSPWSKSDDFQSNYEETEAQGGPTLPYDLIRAPAHVWASVVPPVREVVPLEQDQLHECVTCTIPRIPHSRGPHVWFNVLLSSSQNSSLLSFNLRFAGEAPWDNGGRWNTCSVCVYCCFSMAAS